MSIRIKGLLRKDLSVFREDKDEKKEDPKEKEKEKDHPKDKSHKKAEEKKEKKDKHPDKHEKSAPPAEDAHHHPADDRPDELVNPEFLELFTRAAPLHIEERRSLVLPIISNEEADIWLEDQPDGSSLLRLDEAALPSRYSPLILSYKYQNLAFHYRFDDKVTGTVKIKEKDKGSSTKPPTRPFDALNVRLCYAVITEDSALVCSAEKRTLKFISELRNFGVRCVSPSLPSRPSPLLTHPPHSLLTACAQGEEVCERSGC